MAKVIKVVKKPSAFIGTKLQEKANRMLLHRDTLTDLQMSKYTEIRRSAEWHLRMWAWERTTPPWKLPGETKNFSAPACKKINCPNLPAGSEQCRKGECP